jgi:hypothetical protein
MLNEQNVLLPWQQAFVLCAQTSKQSFILSLLNCAVSIDIYCSFGRFMNTGNNLFIFVGETNHSYNGVCLVHGVKQHVDGPKGSGNDPVHIKAICILFPKNNSVAY